MAFCVQAPSIDNMAIDTQRVTRRSSAAHRSRPPSTRPGSKRPPPDDSARPSCRAMQDIVRPEDLSVVFQPIVDILTGEQFATEALVRCRIAALADPVALFRQAVTHQCSG